MQLSKLLSVYIRFLYKKTTVAFLIERFLLKYKAAETEQTVHTKRPNSYVICTS